MSNKPEILGALRSASGPMTSTEVAEAIGQPATAVGRELYALAREGEIEQVDVDGKAAFLAASGSGAKRRAAPKPAPKPAPERKSAAAKKRAYTRRARPEPVEHEHPQPAPPAATPASAELVNLARGTLRALLAFVFASERPLDARTRTAVIDAAREAA